MSSSQRSIQPSSTGKMKLSSGASSRDEHRPEHYRRGCIAKNPSRSGTTNKDRKGKSKVCTQTTPDAKNESTGTPPGAREELPSSGCNRYLLRSAGSQNGASFSRGLDLEDSPAVEKNIAKRNAVRDGQRVRLAQSPGRITRERQVKNAFKKALFKSD